ncbi:N-acetylmuramoyl-L-alanine amidase-like domain-containing protein [Zooshikella harenae]|uniref:DUF1460 domain-containing protein n=1 Tax=Zooshikella harenae TaxID=2827238 RepID=A0ABS5ZJ84_9GAMM|nr:N-acetylmuramoyl-L-alanine amidase-like domain-containing protein [Zooshikella harenae]MBU2713311.1 DUF1460 domain-containing protein [Zooshikella harenae]
MLIKKQAASLLISLVISSLAPASTHIMGSLLNSTKSLATPQRIEKISELLLNSPYSEGVLGEGINGKYDKDPLYRFDEFDCTTFVEIVLAVSISNSIDSFKVNINNIRYKDGYVSFGTRNHFPSLDWIPNNYAILEDVTRYISPDESKKAVALIDKRAWYQFSKISKIQSVDVSEVEKKLLLEQLKAEGRQFEPVQAELPYIPLDSIFKEKTLDMETLRLRADRLKVIESNASLSESERKKQINQFVLKNRIDDSEIDTALLAKIPSGSIINVVRPNWKLKKWIGTNMNVSHQGFAIRKQGQLFFRHASSEKKAVVDVPFTDYFSQFLFHNSIKGINIQRVTVQNYASSE